MFTDLLHLSRQTLTYGSATVLTRLVAFILVPFFTHYLSPAEFGVQQLFYISVAVGTEILLLGLDVALLRFYVLEKDKERRHRIFSTLWIAGFCVSALLVAVAYVLTPRIVGFVVELPDPAPDWAIYTFRLCLGILWLEILNSFPFMVLRGEGKALPFTLTKIGGAVFQTAFTLIALIGLGRGITGIFEANLASSAVVALSLLPVVITRLRPVFDRAVVKSCLAFGLPNVPNSIFVLAIDLADRKILELLCGPAVTGLYSVGYRLGTFLAIVVAGFRFAWQPFFLSIAGAPNSRQVYGTVLTYYVAIMVWFYLLLIAYIPPLARWDVPGMGMLISPEFWPGLDVFPVILLAHMFNGAYAIFMVGVYLEKKTKALPLITGVAGIVNIAGNLLLVPIFGMWASAWLTVISYAVMTSLLYFYIQRHFPIHYQWRRIIAILGLGAAFFLVSWPLQLLGVPSVGQVSSLLFPLLLYALILEDNEKSKISGLLGIGNSAKPS